MFGLFRRSQTPPDGQRAHQTTLELIEQLTALRGQVRTLEAEWDDMRAQIRRGYQRMEKAYERMQDDAPCPDAQPLEVETAGLPAAHGFVRKLNAMKGA